MLLSSTHTTALSDFTSLEDIFEFDCLDEATERMDETWNFEVLCWTLPRLFVENFVERRTD